MDTAASAPGGTRAPRQNRVTPGGDLIATPARGTLMGNRGRLHDDAGRIVRPVVPGYRAWVTCRLAFRGRRRVIMAPGRYTELFFLDEATALAAGHRPCGECRRADYLRFKAAWLAGNAARGIGARAPIAAIDRVLHAERLPRAGAPRILSDQLTSVPDGVFLSAATAGVPLLRWGGRLWPWSPWGYGPSHDRRPAGPVTILTPASTVAALAAGYMPGVHASAVENAADPIRGRATGGNGLELVIEM